MEQSRQRYASGKRENSFFMEMHVMEKKRTRASVATDDIFEYTYYVDTDGRMIKEKLK